MDMACVAGCAISVSVYSSRPSRGRMTRLTRRRPSMTGVPRMSPETSRPGNSSCSTRYLYLDWTGKCEGVTLVRMITRIGADIRLSFPRQSARSRII